MKDTSYSNTSFLCVCVCWSCSSTCRCNVLSYLFAPHAQRLEPLEFLVHKWLLVTPGIISSTVLYKFNEQFTVCIDDNK